MNEEEQKRNKNLKLISDILIALSFILLIIGLPFKFTFDWHFLRYVKIIGCSLLIIGLIFYIIPYILEKNIKLTLFTIFLILITILFFFFI
ncbi:hypothetical protein ACWEYS_13285 [Staphylococcus xylosus]